VLAPRRRDRQFLMIMGGLAAAGASLLGGIKVLSFMFPQASSNAPALFKTSFTFDQLTGGVVGGKAVTPVNVLSETSKRVTVVLDDAGIYAVLLICTHLGCTPTTSRTSSRLRRIRLGGGCTRRAYPCAAGSQRLGLPVSRQPLFHRFDELLRSGTAADGLGQHRGHSGRLLRGRPGGAGCDPWSREQHVTGVGGCSSTRRRAMARP